jgi:RING-variant domain
MVILTFPPSHVCALRVASRFPFPFRIIPSDCRSPCPTIQSESSDRLLAGRGFSHVTHRRIQAHTLFRSSNRIRMSQQPAGAVDTDEQEQQQPQCRICLDGPDPDLGRLIRPCLCSGTVSVSTATCTFPTISYTHTQLTLTLKLTLTE